MLNSTLTAIKGLRVGHWTHPQRPTGCTVVLCPQGVVAGVDVRDAAPGTRETDLLAPGNTVPHIHALLLAGGSAYGLDAASGVMRWLEAQGHGLQVAGALVPIVPGAVIFDLGLGDPSLRPDAESGWAACEAASTEAVSSGNVGAGTGATVGKILGSERAMKGGLGNSLVRVGPWQVAALVACNALGDVLDPRTGQLLAGARQSADSRLMCNADAALLQGAPTAVALGSNTTIGVIACNARLDKAQAQRLAVAGHDGLARAVRPAHTPMDGDTLFALATGECEQTPNPMLLSAMAAQAVALACVNAVQSASGLRLGSRWWPSAREL